MKKQVVLGGYLGDRYGAEWNITAKSYYDIFQCIEANYPDFKTDLIEIVESGAGLDISTGGELITPEDFINPLPDTTIYITPVPAGAKSGAAKLIAAAAIVAVTFWLSPVTAALAAGTGWTYFAVSTALLIAANLAITGIQQLLAPDPSVDDEEQDYLFKGPENTVASGNPVPVLFGEMIIGGFIISSYVTGGDATVGSYGHIGYLPPDVTYGIYYDLTNSRTIADQLGALSSTGVFEINSAIPDEPADITMEEFNRDIAVFGVYG